MILPEILTVEEALKESGATRLAHFTPAMNLYHILSDGAIRSSKDLADNAPDHFDPTDRERFDRRPDMICCTFQVPNGYYLYQARAKSAFKNYPDWACIYLDIDLVTKPGVVFAPCNAASQNGAFLREGGAALRECFARESFGYKRGARHLRGAATNLQAEVLVPGPVSISNIISVVVPNKTAASSEAARLRLLGVDPASVTWSVSAILFDRDRLRDSVRQGTPPLVEERWPPPHVGAQQ